MKHKCIICRRKVDPKKRLVQAGELWLVCQECAKGGRFKDSLIKIPEEIRDHRGLINVLMKINDATCLQNESEAIAEIKGYLKTVMPIHGFGMYRAAYKTPYAEYEETLSGYEALDVAFRDKLTHVVKVGQTRSRAEVKHGK